MKTMKQPSFHLDSNNGGLLKPPTVRVSTIRLPNITGLHIPGGPYETCVFSGKESDVVERYEDMESAIAGHNKHCRNVGIAP